MTPVLLHQPQNLVKLCRKTFFLEYDFLSVVFSHTSFHATSEVLRPE